jgi:hypothetical protein
MLQPPLPTVESLRYPLDRLRLVNTTRHVVFEQSENARVCVRACVRVCVCMHACMYACVCMYVCMHVCMFCADQKIQRYRYRESGYTMHGERMIQNV